MSTTVSSRLAEQLRERIRGGQVKRGELLGTEMELVRSSGFSRTAVRSAVNRLVGEGLIERRPGKGLFTTGISALRVVEAIVPALPGGLWQQVAWGAQQVAAEAGVKFQIYSAELNEELDRKAMQAIPDQGIDGALIGSMHVSRLIPELYSLHRQGVPFVLLDDHQEGLPVSTVTFDDRRIGRDAAEILLARGHRRIGFIGFAQRGYLSGRLDGVRDAVAEAGIVFSRSCLVETTPPMLTDKADAEWSLLRRRIGNLLEQPDRPSAVVCHFSAILSPLYQAAGDLGLRIPDDLSVIAIGLPSDQSHLKPAASFMGLPAEEMGRLGMKRLLERLAAPETPLTNDMLPAVWHEGESVSKPRS